MNNVVIIDGVRTPFGKYRGGLSDLSSVDLGLAVLHGLMDRNPGLIPEQAIFGSVLTKGLGQNIARQIAIKGGLPVSTPAFTVNEVCGSGLKAVLLARQAIALGEADLILAGGTESMSQSETMQGDGLTDAFENIPMGRTVESLVSEFKISRQAQDEFALQSHQRAAEADFSKELIPVKGSINLETIRPGTSLEKLSQLKTVFLDGGTITSGNASPVNDGAGAALLSSETFAKKHQVPILAKIVASVDVGVAPERMGISPITAIQKLLTKTELKLDDIDRFEINEAFAASSLIINQELDLDPSKVNTKGGAIALGHPLGATGSRLVTTLAHQLKEENLRYGIASLCIGGGLGLATLLENPNA